MIPFTHKNCARAVKLMRTREGGRAHLGHGSVGLEIVVGCDPEQREAVERDTDAEVVADADVGVLGVEWEGGSACDARRCEDEVTYSPRRASESHPCTFQSLSG
jgi:hypothetical protein